MPTSPLPRLKLASMQAPALITRASSASDGSSSSTSDTRSCTPPLRLIPSTQNPGNLPHLNPFWRGHCHGLASCLLPTRSVGAYLALCHVASHWVQTRSDHPTGAGPAQAPQYHRDQTVRGSDAKTALRPV